MVNGFALQLRPIKSCTRHHNAITSGDSIIVTKPLLPLAKTFQKAKPAKALVGLRSLVHPHILA